MNYPVLTIVLYVITWLLAVVFFAMYTKANSTFKMCYELLEDADNLIENLRSQIEIDEKLLNDPGLNIVTYCSECRKRETCEMYLTLKDTKKPYCSEGTVKDAKHDMETAEGT